MPTCSRCARFSLLLVCLALSGCTISSTPGTKTPESLSIVPANPALLLGLAQPFFATAKLHDGSIADVTQATQWSSSKTAVATIDRTGMLQTVAQGTTTVTAVYGPLSANTGVSVGPPGIITVGINPANPGSIEVGSTLQFTATGIMSNGSPPPDLTNKVTWASSNTTVATVSSSGTTMADRVGMTAISATYGTGASALSASANLIVDPVLRSISILPRSATIAENTSQQFTATAFYGDGSTQDITHPTTTQWTSTPTTIASINAGLAKSNSTTGSSTIAATSASVSNQAKLTVSALALTKLSVIPAIPSLPVGVPVQFQATGQFGASGPVQDLTAAPGIRWSSSTSSVAKNPSAGKTTTQAPGTTTITAKFGSTTATSTLTVTSATLSAITITTPLNTLALGTTMQLKATGKFTDGSTQDLTNAVAWKSSSLAIQISSSGLATATFPASATVKASLAGVSGTTPALQVNLVDAKSVAITPASATIAPGTTLPFKATATFSDSTQQDITSLVQWNSSDPSAATIDDFGGSAGLASAIGAGTPSISAVFGSLDASMSTLTVTGARPASSTSLSITASPSMALGTSQQLTATVKFNDGTSQDVTPLVTWASSDITVLVVNRTGLAVSAGNRATATVMAIFTSPLSGKPTATGVTTITVQ